MPSNLKLYLNIALKSHPLENNYCSRQNTRKQWQKPMTSRTFLERHRRKCTIKHSSLFIRKSRSLHVDFWTVDLSFRMGCHGKEGAVEDSENHVRDQDLLLKNDKRWRKRLCDDRRGAWNKGLFSLFRSGRRGACLIEIMAGGRPAGNMYVWWRCRSLVISGYARSDKIQKVDSNLNIHNIVHHVSFYGIPIFHWDTGFQVPRIHAQWIK